MNGEERFIRIVRVTAQIGMSIAVFLMCGHVLLGWFPFGYRWDAWYYPTIISLQMFYILVHLWIVRLRRQTP